MSQSATDQLMGLGTPASLALKQVELFLGGGTNASMFFSSRTLAQATAIVSNVTAIQTAGYTTAGDGGGALYIHASGSTSGGFQSLDGQWWQLAGPSVDVRAFGMSTSASGAANRTALQSAIDSAMPELIWPPGTFNISDYVNGTSDQYWKATRATILKMTGTPTDNMVRFNSESNFGVGQITLDWNNNASNVLGPLAIGDCDHFTIDGVRAIHIDRIGIGVSGADVFRVQNCEIERDSTTTHLSIGILMSGVVGPLTNFWIKDNYLKNCVINATGAQGLFSHNIVDGHGYGGGVTTAQDSVNSHTLIISENILSGNTDALDADGTAPPGIENWAQWSIVANNITFGNAGNGVSQGAAYCIVEGNLSFNNGLYLAGVGSGFNSIYSDATYQALKNVWSSNLAFDTSGGAGTQQWGFYESGTVTYQFLDGNLFIDNKTAPTSLTGGAYRSFVGPALEFSDTWDPGSIADGDNAIHGITAQGASLGDRVEASFSLDIAGLTLTAYVNTGNSVIANLANNTGAPVDLSSGTVRVTVFKNAGAANF